jgi:hypothetical protein
VTSCSVVMLLCRLGLVQFSVHGRPARATQRHAIPRARTALVRHGCHAPPLQFDRYVGFWWSPDGTRIAFQETDDTHIPAYHIPHVGSDDPAASEQHRYPFAGAANPIVRLGVLDLEAQGTCRLLGAGIAVVFVSCICRSVTYFVRATNRKDDDHPLALQTWMADRRWRGCG